MCVGKGHAIQNHLVASKRRFTDAVPPAADLSQKKSNRSPAPRLLPSREEKKKGRIFSIIAALIDNEIELRVFEIAVDERCMIRVRHFHVVGYRGRRNRVPPTVVRAGPVRPLVGHTVSWDFSSDV